MQIVPIAPDIDPSLAIREADIKRIFPPGTLTAGRSYEQRGRVQDLEIAARGAIITATTQGWTRRAVRRSGCCSGCSSEQRRCGPWPLDRSSGRISKS